MSGTAATVILSVELVKIQRYQTVYYMTFYKNNEGLLGGRFLNDIRDLLVGFLDVAVGLHAAGYPTVVTVPNLQQRDVHIMSYLHCSLRNYV
jgi:hypothetical protein